MNRAWTTMERKRGWQMIDAGKSFAEVAEALERSVSSVKTGLARSKKKVKTGGDRDDGSYY